MLETIKGLCQTQLLNINHPKLLSAADFGGKWANCYIVYILDAGDRIQDRD